jgi:hypothetical protein
MPRHVMAKLGRHDLQLPRGCGVDAVSMLGWMAGWADWMRGMEGHAPSLCGCIQCVNRIKLGIHLLFLRGQVTDA